MADQSTFFDVPGFHQCRAANILVLCFVLVSEIGCSSARPSMKSLWQQVPPVRWSNKDPLSASAKQEKVAEPAVAANVAIKSDSAVQAESAEGFATTDTKSKPQRSRLSPRFSRPDNRSNEGMPAFESSDVTEPKSNPFDSEMEGADSPLERLNAALSDDALQAQSLPQRSVTMLEERFRVDTLLSRANRLIEIGQLQQARESALLAQEVGDAAQLDYSPDEDRPIDLIRRIDGQLEEIRLAEHAGSEENIEPAQVVTVPEVPVPSETAASTNSPEKELKVLTPKNRNWSAFFRREKKSPSMTNDSGIRPAEAVTPEPSVVVRNNSRPVSRSNKTAPHDAVVMANRSVSLGTAEPVSETSTRAPLDSNDQNTSFDDISPSSDSRPASLEVSRLRSDRTVSFAVSSDSSRSTFEPDEGTSPLPEIDAVDTELPRHIDETSNDDETNRPEKVDSIEPIRTVDEWFVYLAIGACTVLAVICYRRGAT